MRKKILSGVLAACLLAMPATMGASPMLAAESGVAKVVSHTHDDGVWKAWSGTSSLWGEGATYYLAQDITLTRPYDIRVTGSPTLCLNGHILDANQNKLRFQIQPGASLTICDCSEQTTYGYLDAEGLWHPSDSAVTDGTACNLQGGVITGHSSGMPLVHSYGSFVLQSGNIAGNKMTNPNTALMISEVNAGKGGVIHIQDGQIIGNHARIVSIQGTSSGSMSGGVIAHNKGNAVNVSGRPATFHLSGGEIYDNASTTDGVIRVLEQSILQLSGAPVIRDNVGVPGCNGISCRGDIELVGPVDFSNRVGVYAQTQNVMIKNWAQQMVDKNPADYFYAENEETVLAKNDAGEVTFVKHQHGTEPLTPWQDGVASGHCALMSDVALQAPVTVTDGLTLCLNGHQMSNAAGAVLTLQQGATLQLYDCPRQNRGAMSGKEAALVLNTAANATVAQAAVDASGYQGAPMKVQEAQPADAVGGCAVKGAANTFELVNPGYHYEYREGGYYVAADTYKIAYKNADGSAFVENPQDAPIVHTYGNETTLPQPSKAGYRFDGWYESADGSGQPLTTIAANTTKDITLYGKWTPVVEVPIITAQPQDVTMTQGERAALSVQAKAAFDGDVLSYQWYETAIAEDTSNGQALSGATQATFEIPREQEIGTGYYYCVVTAEREGVSKTVASKVAKVTVQAPVAPPQPPVIIPDDTVTHPDGSVTTIVTKPNGDKVATTTYPNSDRVALTTTPAGTINVAIHGTSPRLVRIPVEGLNAGTVAMVTDMQGKAALEQCCVPTKEGLALMVSDGDRVEICQKSPFFVDVAADYWAVDNITFAAARGLVVGVDATHFAPEGETTRAMIWSILSRMEGVSASGGSDWYVPGQEWAMANGVSDGTQPMTAITREQLAAMLYRYAGAPAVAGDVAAFSDADAVSDWAKQAMTWAVNEGLIAGMSADTLAPQGTATRAQTAAILQRFIAWQLGINE